MSGANERDLEAEGGKRKEVMNGNVWISNVLDKQCKSLLASNAKPKKWLISETKLIILKCPQNSAIKLNNRAVCRKRNPIVFKLFQN